MFDSGRKGGGMVNTRELSEIHFWKGEKLKTGRIFVENNNNNNDLLYHIYFIIIIVCDIIFYCSNYTILVCIMYTRLYVHIKSAMWCSMFIRTSYYFIRVYRRCVNLRL